MEEKSKLMTPLFLGIRFNRDGRRIRAVLVKTVSNDTGSYNLWRKAGKPDNKYASAANDTHYLYMEVNGYLVPLGLTEFLLTNRCGAEAVDERYGGGKARRQYLDKLREAEGIEAYCAALDNEQREIELLGSDSVRQAHFIQKFLDDHAQTYLKSKECGGKSYPDFAGALVLDELEKCRELSAIYQAMKKEEQQALVVRAEEEDRAFCEEKNRIANQAVSDAIQIIRNGGVLKNDTVKFYSSKYDVSSCSIVLYLMRKYNIDIPLRTQGWVKSRLADVQIKDGWCGAIHYWRSGKSRGSTTIYTHMNKLIKAVMAQTQADSA